MLEDAENEFSPIARECLNVSYEELLILDEKVNNMTGRLEQVASNNGACQLLQSMVGVGPIVSTILWVALGDVKPA